MNWWSEPNQQSLSFLGRRSTFPIPFAFMAVVMISAIDATAAPTIFECVDSHGQIVFTDSPRQRLACRALKLTSSAQGFQPSSAPTSALSTMKSRADAPAPTPASPAAVPVERLGNILVVSATLNGSRQARLIVDTGASQTIISQRMAFDLGLYPTAHHSQVLLHTASGTVQADSMVLDSLRIAGAEIRNSPVLIYDLPDLPLAVDGLLGLSFLGAYQVTLDIARGELLLKASQSKLGGIQ